MTGPKPHKGGDMGDGGYRKVMALQEGKGPGNYWAHTHTPHMH